MVKGSWLRGILILAVVLTSIAALVAGGRVAFDATQRKDTAAAFGAAQSVADRIDLQNIIPNATRSESGVAIRLGGSGDGPTITYTFNAAEAPNWGGRLVAAMKKAGYGGGYDGAGGWSFDIGDHYVTVLTSLPGDSKGAVSITAN